MNDFEVNLPIPFISQFDPNIVDQRDACGPTSVAMALKYLGDNVDEQTIFQLSGAASGTPITFAQLMKAITSRGYSYDYEAGLSFDDLKRALQQGMVPIVLVKAQYLTSRQDQKFTGGHFFPVCGYRSDGVTVNDPDFYGSFRAQGDHHFYTMSDFLNAWGKCSEDGNPNNAALVIHPKGQDALSACMSDRTKFWQQRDAYIAVLNDIAKSMHVSLTIDENTPLDQIKNAFVQAFSNTTASDQYKTAVNEIENIIKNLS